MVGDGLVRELFCFETGFYYVAQDALELNNTSALASQIVERTCVSHMCDPAM